MVRPFFNFMTKSHIWRRATGSTPLVGSSEHNRPTAGTKRNGDHQTTLHAAGQVGRLRGLGVPQLELGKNLVHVPDHFLAGQVALELAVELKVLAHGHEAEQDVLLRAHPDVALHLVQVRLRVDAVHVGTAACRLQEAAYHVDCCRFPCSVKDPISLLFCPCNCYFTLRNAVLLLSKLAW